LVTALTAPMAQGRLYEVDMRLRPSGTQGPVATSWASFTHYQRNEAWVWEHLALTRARVVAGSSGLSKDIDTFREEFMAQPRDRGKVLREMSDMRNRLSAAKSPSGVWDAKPGAGRMMDVELVAQTGALLAGLTVRDVPGGLAGAVAAGWLNVAESKALTDSYHLFWSVQAAARLLSGRAIDATHLGEGGAAFLCRSTGHHTLEALQADLEGRYAQCAALINGALKRELGDEIR